MSLIVFTPAEALKAITANPNNLVFEMKKEKPDAKKAQVKFIHVTLNAIPYNGTVAVKAPLRLSVNNVEMRLHTDLINTNDIEKNPLNTKPKFDVDISTTGDLGNFYIQAEKLFIAWVEERKKESIVLREKKIVLQYKQIYEPEHCRDDKLAGLPRPTKLLRLKFDSDPYPIKHPIATFAGKPKSTIYYVDENNKYVLATYENKPINNSNIANYVFRNSTIIRAHIYADSANVSTAGFCWGLQLGKTIVKCVGEEKFSDDFGNEENEEVVTEFNDLDITDSQPAFINDI